MLVHTVYFWLKPRLSLVQRAEFRRGVESLGRIKSVEKIYVGAPAGVPDREVVDKSFSIGLTVVCKNIKAHNAYQIDPIHLAFVEKFKTCWKRVQVYDVE